MFYFYFPWQTGGDIIRTESRSEFSRGETGLAEAEVPVYVCVRSLRGGLAEHDEPRYGQTNLEVPVVWETPS